VESVLPFLFLACLIGSGGLVVAQGIAPESSLLKSRRWRIIVPAMMLAMWLGAILMPLTRHEVLEAGLWMQAVLAVCLLRVARDFFRALLRG
jgi:hypothetical protein